MGRWIRKRDRAGRFTSCSTQSPRNAVHKHRELRGLTSAGRKGRGLRARGHKANKLKGSSFRGNWLRRQKRNVSYRRYR